MQTPGLAQVLVRSIEGAQAGRAVRAGCPAAHQPRSALRQLADHVSTITTWLATAIGPQGMSTIDSTSGILCAMVIRVIRMIKIAT
jgi:hypothetical protein